MAHNLKQAAADVKAEVQDGSLQLAVGYPRQVAGMSSKKVKKEILARSKTLAKALLNAVSHGKLLSKLAKAGSNFEKHGQQWDELEALYEEFEQAPWDGRLQAAVEEKEAEFTAAMDYKTGEEYGDQQPEFLKAMDFFDEISPDFKLYNLCRANTGWDEQNQKACACGFAFPSKLWKQEGSRWKFSCQVDWNRLIEAAAAEGSGAGPACSGASQAGSGPLAQWVEKLKLKYGDVSQWPKFGCNSQFVPWKKGKSMVAEIRIEGDQWEAIVCDRLPSKMDDAIKEHQREFYLASEKISLDRLAQGLATPCPTGSSLGLLGPPRSPEALGGSCKPLPLLHGAAKHPEPRGCSIRFL